MKYLVIGLLLLFSVGVLVFNYNKKTDKEIVFGTVQIPFSSDPIDFDYYTHHYAFSSVFAKLISSEKSGEVFPMLASEWSHLNEFRVWKFKIRKGLEYSNGDMISAADILMNFKRLTFLKKNRDSRSGLLEFLEGYSSFKHIGDNLEGLSVDEDWFILKFNKPMPNLLDIVSFGFYGLAHPSLYDHKTGEWIKNAQVISSGSYEVLKWDKDNYELGFRKESVFVDSEDRIKKIKFELIQKIKTSKDLEHIDILVADKNSLLINDNFQYLGSAHNLKIGYLKCHSWNKVGSPFQNRNIRKWFRKKFYENLRLNQFPVTKSFFPTNITGLKAIVDSDLSDKPVFPLFKLTTHPISLTTKIEENKDKKSIAEIFSDALLALGKDTGAILIQEDLPNDNMYDVAISGTGIESVNYWESVKFMFLSKDGINLPDESGIIIKELAKENPDLSVINQELWDQAIIWPIRHYSSGYWFHKKSNIDYSEINFDSASIDFQFFKIK